MKIADQPAFPLSGDKHQSEIGKGVLSHDYKGLTKREMFAAIAMQGILAARYEANPVLHTPSPADTIQDAIRYADELLKQLES